MDDGLFSETSLASLGLRTTGRAVGKVVAEVEGELTTADLLTLGEEKGSTATPIKKLRQRHHALARALADGLPAGEAGIMCGYSASRVSILLGDKTFQELIEFYSGTKRERYLEMHELIAGLAEDAVEELTERLETSPEDITVGQLLEISKMSLDRSGYGPTSTATVNVNVGLAEKLQKARQRAQLSRASRGLLIDSTAEEVEFEED